MTDRIQALGAGGGTTDSSPTGQHTVPSVSRGGQAEEERCYQTLRHYRWPKGLACVWCGSDRVTVHTRGRGTPRRRYLCLDCHRTFTDLTGTIFAQSNLPLSKWFRALSLLNERLTIPEYARALSVKWDTARRVFRILTQSVGKSDLVRSLRSAVDRNVDPPDGRSG